MHVCMCVKTRLFGYVSLMCVQVVSDKSVLCVLLHVCVDMNVCTYREDVYEWSAVFSLCVCQNVCVKSE